MGIKHESPKSQTVIVIDLKTSNVEPQGSDVTVIPRMQYSASPHPILSNANVTFSEP